MYTRNLKDPTVHRWGDKLKQKRISSHLKKEKTIHIYYYKKQKTKEKITTHLPKLSADSAKVKGQSSHTANKNKA